MRLLWLADALRDEGLTVVEVDGWRSRGSELVGVHGVMFHHTATPIGVEDSAPLRTVTFGRSDLPGPICNVMLGRDLKAYVVAAGRANHAGIGGPWRTVPEAISGTSGNAGNERLFALEAVNNGVGEPWRDEFLDRVDRIFAAVLKRFDKDETWCLGHKEWTSRKIDPSLDMDAYRRRLRAYLEGDLMAILTDAEQRQLRGFLTELRQGLGTLDPTDDPATDEASAAGAAQRVARAVLKVEAGPAATTGITKAQADELYAGAGHRHEQGQTGPPTG